MSDYLIESCLLSHGLKSISDEEVFNSFKAIGGFFVWLESGKIKIGEIEEFIAFRSRCVRRRCNRELLREFCDSKVNAALTASGTMEVCRMEGIPVAVTCGIGGIDLQDPSIAVSDLIALSEMDVTLLATSPKDVVDIPKSVKWLKDHQVTVLGVGTDICSGYVFNSAKERLSGVLDPDTVQFGGHQLILNGIDPDTRIQDNRILTTAIEAGRTASARGEYYHPAANACLDELTKGHSSVIQLQSIRENAFLARALTTKKKQA